MLRRCRAAERERRPLHERAECRARANVAQAAGFRDGGGVGLTLERG